MTVRPTLSQCGRPNRPGGVVVGKTTHVWYPRVSVAGPAIPSCSVAVVACVGNPGSNLDLGDMSGSTLRACMVNYSASHTHCYGITLSASADPHV
jgi:hypothetical protein